MPLSLAYGQNEPSLEYSGNVVDVFIVGGGPAGLAAAIAARQRGSGS